MKRKIIYSTMVILLCAFGVSAQTPVEALCLEAAENNPELKAKYDLYLAALARIDQQNSLPDPTLNFGYFISPVETRVGAQRFKLSISQMFPWLGTNKTKESIASSQAKVQFEEFMDLKSVLYFKVRNAYLDLQMLKEELRLKQEDIEILKSYEPITKAKYEANLVSMSDLIRVQIVIQNAKTELEILESQKAQLLSELNTLLNRPVDVNIEVEELVKNVSPSNETLDSALVNHGSITAAKARIVAAEQQQALAQLGNKPSFGLGLDYAFVSKRTDISIPDNGKDILMPMVSFSLPIFNKKNKARIKEYELLKSSAEEMLTAQQNKLKNDWEAIQYQNDKAKLRQAQFEYEIEQTEVMVRVLLAEYSNSNTNFEELLATQQKLLLLRTALIKTVVDQSKAAIRKNYLTGSNLKEFEVYENQ